jgi:hypothetical protein
VVNPVSALEAPLTVPYVTVASFRAWPSLLALGNLNSYSTVQTDQDAELYDLLLMSSQWAADECDQPLHGHVRVDLGQDRVRADGRLSHHAEHNPVRQLTGFSYGFNGPVGMTVVTDLTNQWVEGEEIILPWGGSLTGGGLGLIQFSPPNPSSQIYGQWAYVAGYGNTILAATANSGTTSITVTDPTGIYPGDVLRIYDPGKEEAVTVGAAYVVGATTVPLVAALTQTHTVAGTGAAQQIGVSMLTPAIREAVCKRTLASLLRPITQAEDPFPGNAPKISTRKGDSRGNGAGLVADACRLLNQYKRIR